MADRTTDVGHILISPPDRSYYACPSCRIQWLDWFDAREHMTETHGWPALQSEEASDDG